MVLVFCENSFIGYFPSPDRDHPPPVYLIPLNPSSRIDTVDRYLYGPSRQYVNEHGRYVRLRMPCYSSNRPHRTQPVMELVGCDIAHGQDWRGRFSIV
jgi:hypothetical protein